MSLECINHYQLNDTRNPSQFPPDYHDCYSYNHDYVFSCSDSCQFVRLMLGMYGYG